MVIFSCSGKGLIVLLVLPLISLCDASALTNSHFLDHIPYITQERDLFVQEIHRFLRTHDSKMLKHMPAMLSDYRDKEEDLLKELYDEYVGAYVAYAEFVN